MDKQIDGMRLVVSRNSLRHTVGMLIFCPTCRTIMDARRAVEITLSKSGRSRTAASCAKCWDEAKAGVEASAQRAGIAIEVLDGRVLFHRGGRRKEVASACA